MTGASSIYRLVFGLAILAHLVIYIAPANLDMADGRYSLHMDERIIFDQIDPLIQADGPRELVDGFVGTDHRYGRQTYVIAAPFAKILDAVFGTSGQIIGTRFAFYAVILAISVWVFYQAGATLTGTLAATAILLLPHSDYYATMPKPDTLQVLCLMMACLASFRAQPIRAGLFTGLGIGLKLSGIIVLPVLLIFYIQRLYDDAPNSLARFKTVAKSAGLWCGALAIGFLLNVPMLLTGSDKWDLYVLSTSSQFIHGDNISGSYFASWIGNISHVLRGRVLSVILILILLFVSFAVLSRRHTSVGQPFYYPDGSLLKRLGSVCKYLATFLLARTDLPTLVWGLSVAWLASIVLFVPRLWGIYLWPSLILLIWAAALLSKEHTETYFGSKSFRVIFSTLCLGIILVFPFSLSAKHLTELKLRSTAPAHITKQAQYEQANRYLDSLNIDEGTELIHYDPRLYQIRSTANLKIANYWGPYHHWGEKPRAIINLDDSFVTFENPANLYQTEMNDVAPMAKRHLLPPHGTCEDSHCYFLRIASDGLHIWERQ